MTALLWASLFRPFALVAAAFVVLRVFRVRHPASQHQVWTAVLLGMLILPPLTVFAPALNLAVFQPPPVPASRDREGAVQVETQLPKPLPDGHGSSGRAPYSAAPHARASLPPLVWCYLAGLLLVATYQITGWMLLRRVISRSTPLRARPLRESGELVVPVAVGLLRPAVILPSDWRTWSRDTQRAVLAHELAHIRRKDAAVLAVSRVIRCLFWFHPLAWWTSRKISELAEMACDAAVIERHSDPGGYARILLEFTDRVRQAGHRAALPGLAMARRSGMSKRIDHVFEFSGGNLRRLAKPGLVLALFGIPVMCFAAVVNLTEIRLSEAFVPAPVTVTPPGAVEKTVVAQVRPPIPTPTPRPAASPSVQMKVLPVTVVDTNGKLLTNIPQSDFKVYENGIEQPITVFRREDVPVSMGILVDNSGSMRDKRDKVAAAAMAFVRASNPQDEVFVVNFNDDSFLDQPFTDDLTKLQDAFKRLDARGGTAMRSAISRALDYISQNGKKDKKVLLVVTDGNDNSSSVGVDQIQQELKQSGVILYSIGLLSEAEPTEARDAKRALNALAAISGGRDFYPRDAADVESIASQIADEIRNQYIIAYSPTNQTLDGAFREIKVTVAGRGKVRTRMGYFATR